MCVTILFNFQRRVLKDGKFVTDTREWLAKLVAILLRVATWQDHLFLLNHILRCPGGVMNWAKSFVQVPVHPKVTSFCSSPFNDVYLDHMIATLAVILLPIKERDKFLEQVNLESKHESTQRPFFIRVTGSRIVVNLKTKSGNCKSNKSLFFFITLSLNENKLLNVTD